MIKPKKVFRAVMTAIVLIGLRGCSEKRGGDYLVEVIFPKELEAHCVPVTLELPAEIEDTATDWMLTPRGGKSGETVYAQTIGDTPSKKIVFLLKPGSISAGETQRFILRKRTKPETSPEAPRKVPSVFSFEELDNKFLTLSQDGFPVMTYVYGMNLKEDVPEDRTRSSYIHPVYGLDGEVLTDDFPEDHYHHRGIYTAWPLVIVDGDSLDLWHIRGIEKRFERWLEKETGPVFARLGVQTGWYAGGKKVVDEKLRVTVFKSGDVGRILDFEVVLEAVEFPVTLAGSPDLKGYGGFNYRPAPFEEEMITTRDGTQSDSNLMRFPWADFSARFEGKKSQSGVAIFEDAGNINSPNGWTLRHYGFLGIAWPGNNPYVLEPGRPLGNRYRVWVHRGDAGQGKVSSAFRTYDNPPQAAVLK